MIRRAALLALALTALIGCASTPRADYVQRVELLALLQTLNAELLSHDSATATLERWCAEHRLAQPALIVARRVREADKPLPAELRTRLAAAPDEPIAYRHVQLACGERVLSDADNWYLPDRLTPDMNRELERTDTPFGKVVKALGFQRRTFAAQLLWSPLPPQWEMGDLAATTQALHPPAFVLRHEAVLYTDARGPFSVVVENYTDALFDFGRWSKPR